MAVQGPFKVLFGDVFPLGAFGRSVEPVRDFDASKPGAPVQARDKETGLPLWVVSVIDADPEAREAALRVKVAAPVQPVLPEALPGLPFRPVEFEGLSVTPYVSPGNGRLAFSLRATGVHGPGAAAGAGGRDGKGSAA
ncbi:MAG TPA: plasmid replication, integration and excision activator [Dermatophilaceae bacterium]|nr:plasmid replication, integration and excision activator [Dermatophilaceae bacterium]